VAIEPIDDDNPIEEILLTGFPNPDRVGCPPSAVIEALGQKKIGRDDPAWEHIWNCSPCFKDFKVIRDARLAEIEGRYRAQRRLRNLVLAASVLVCAIILAALFYRKIGELRGGAAVVAIDLTNAGTVRGDAEDNARVLAELPTRLDEIHLKLPVFSQHGRYVVAILQSKSQNAAVALGSATTTGTDVNPSLDLTFDLSGTKPGRYFLATRLEEQGQQDAVYYYPVQIGPG
jgi:hypothetical protein